MPHWLEKRPTTTTGVAIPWMHTEEKDDEEIMRVMAFMNPDKVATAIHFRRCGVCGVKISPLDKCHFLSAKSDTIDKKVHAFVTPPMHSECVEYYLVNHDQLHYDLKMEAVDDFTSDFEIRSATRFHAEWRDEIDGFLVFTRIDNTDVKGTNAVNYRPAPLIVDVLGEEE